MQPCVGPIHATCQHFFPRGATHARKLRKKAPARGGGGRQHQNEVSISFWVVLPSFTSVGRCRCETSRGTRCSTPRPSASPRRAPRDRRCPGEQRAGAAAPDGPCVSGPSCAGMLALCSCGFGTSVGTDERRRPCRPRSGRARRPARGGSRIR